MEAPTPPPGSVRLPHQDDLPVQTVTMNQVVAHNIAYFRNALSLTQEELGGRLERITGRRWSKATMSAVERSWDGNRIRSFDADDLLALSQALEVPVTALFLPPEEDGTVTDYVFTNVGSSPYRDRTVKGGGTGAELLAQLFASEYDYMRGGDAFLERLQEALDFYYGSVPEDFFITRPAEPIDEDVAVDEQVNKLRRQIATLREVMATLDRAASKLGGANSADGPQYAPQSDGPDPEDVALFDESYSLRHLNPYQQIGQSLSEARRGNGMTVDDVAKATRVRPDILRSIESGEFRPCGGDVYARGFIRAIAKALGIDHRQYLAEYDAARRAEKEAEEK